MANRTVNQFNRIYGTTIKPPHGLTPIQADELAIIKPAIQDPQIMGIGQFKQVLAKQHIRANYYHAGDNSHHGSKFQGSGISFDYFPKGPIHRVIRTIHRCPH